MAKLSGFSAAVYEALDRVRQTALVRFDSLFSPGQPIWTLENLERFHRMFVENFDEGEGVFLDKFHTQLKNADDGVLQLAAELLYVQQFFTSLTKPEKKIENVKVVLSWAKRSIEIPPWALAALEIGLAGDQSFNQHRPFHLAWLVGFLIWWHKLDAHERHANLENPWAFRELVLSLESVHGAYQPMREAWLYMMFPDTFENISSRKDKKAIAQFYREKLSLSPGANVDEDLLQIRSRSTAELGAGFSFYKGQAKQWKPAAIAAVTREELIAAMGAFDANHRQSPEWIGWESDGNNKFAVVHDAKRYPPKQVLSLASEVSKKSFSGGEQTNKIFTSQGFEVIELRNESGPLNGLSAALTKILSGYEAARKSGSYSKDHPVVAEFRRAQQALRESRPVASRPRLRVEYSAGKGNWASVPWISIMDERETDTTQNGRYVVFLFRENNTCVYLTLNQGVTQPTREHGRQEGLRIVHERALQMRSQLGTLSEDGFVLDDNIQLQEEQGLGKSYEASTVAHKMYQRDAVPSDQILEEDLEAVLSAYEDVLEPDEPARAWIFQANPETYDVVGAINRLPEMSWTVSRHAGKIHVGDRVFLWESGKNAGVVGTAEVVQGVSEITATDDEAAFWRKPQENKAVPRVRIRIDDVLGARLPKQRLVDDPRFADLGFLRGPMGTNFPLTDEHRRALEEMIAPSEVPPDELCEAFAAAIRTAGLTFGDDHDSLVQRFLASVMTKPFLILTGLSGSGKTQLALRLGEWLGESRYRVIAVRPDWTGPDSLLGYEDALLPASSDGRRAWHVPDALAHILRAARDPERPYLLILDEMNLAHVERYFADVLSGIESRSDVLPNLELADGHWRANAVKPHIPIPRNLIIVGTVNVDETTYMFSPKVLDRANTIEFRVPTSALPTDVSKLTKPTKCKAAGEAELISFLRIIADDTWHTVNAHEELTEFAQLVRTVHEALSTHGFEFGHRTYYEALRLAVILDACGIDEVHAAIDVFLLQKVLPRLHGSRRRLEPVLRVLAAFSFDRHLGKAAEFDPLQDMKDKTAHMPRSFAKLRRMTTALYANQFASFTD